MLCYASQRTVLKLSFLAKPHHPNGYNNWVALINPLEEYGLDTHTIHRHPWHEPDHGPAYDHDHNHNHGLKRYSLSSHNPDLLPWHFMHLVYSRTT